MEFTVQFLFDKIVVKDNLILVSHLFKKREYSLSNVDMLIVYPAQENKFETYVIKFKDGKSADFYRFYKNHKKLVDYLLNAGVKSINGYTNNEYEN
jgi:hypothetical protein